MLSRIMLLLKEGHFWTCLGKSAACTITQIKEGLAGLAHSDTSGCAVSKLPCSSLVLGVKKEILCFKT